MDTQITQAGTASRNPQHDAALRRLEYNRERMASDATGGASTERMLAHLYDIARCEVEVALEREVEQALKSGVPSPRLVVAEAAREQLMRRGSDDDWSGRGNDLRRVQADSTRRWVNAVFDAR